MSDSDMQGCRSRMSLPLIRATPICSPGESDQWHAAFEPSLSRQISAKQDGSTAAIEGCIVAYMTYKIVATRGDEILRSERESLLIAAAKARVWANVGWHVVVTDGDGNTVDPAEFERLFAPPDPRRAKLKEVVARLHLAASK